MKDRIDLYQRAKQRLETITAALERTKGRRQAVLESLQEYECKDADEVREKLNELEGSLRRLNRRVKSKTEAFDNEWFDVLADKGVTLGERIRVGEEGRPRREGEARERAKTRKRRR